MTTVSLTEAMVVVVPPRLATAVEAPMAEAVPPWAACALRMLIVMGVIITIITIMAVRIAAAADTAIIRAAKSMTMMMDGAVGEEVEDMTIMRMSDEINQLLG